MTEIEMDEMVVVLDETIQILESAGVYLPRESGEEMKRRADVLSKVRRVLMRGY